MEPLRPMAQKCSVSTLWPDETAEDGSDELNPGLGWKNTPERKQQREMGYRCRVTEKVESESSAPRSGSATLELKRIVEVAPSPSRPSAVVGSPCRPRARSVPRHPHSITVSASDFKKYGCNFAQLRRHQITQPLTQAQPESSKKKADVFVPYDAWKAVGIHELTRLAESRIDWACVNQVWYPPKSELGAQSQESTRPPSPAVSSGWDESSDCTQRHPASVLTRSIRSHSAQSRMLHSNASTPRSEQSVCLDVPAPRVRRARPPPAPSKNGSESSRGIRTNMAGQLDGTPPPLMLPSTTSAQGARTSRRAHSRSRSDIEADDTPRVSSARTPSQGRDDDLAESSTARSSSRSRTSRRSTSVTRPPLPSISGAWR